MPQTKQQVPAQQFNLRPGTFYVCSLSLDEDNDVKVSHDYKGSVLAELLGEDGEEHGPWCWTMVEAIKTAVTQITEQFGDVIQKGDQNADSSETAAASSPGQ